MDHEQMTTVAFGVAVVCAGLMGYAIQSGATCTVYAVSELIEKRRASRLLALLEAGLWVAATLIIAAWLEMAPVHAGAFELSKFTVLGGILLGLGAYVNGACVFGSVARVGSGEIGFLITPLGFFLGVELFETLVGIGPLRLPEAASSLARLPLLLLAAFMMLALARAGRIIWRAVRRDQLIGAAPLWNPHVATLVIGITFAIMLLGVGPWTYTELLTDLAKGKSDDIAWRVALFAALLTGARIGGLRHGMTAWTTPTRKRIQTCLIGGAMMGIGGALIPGGNDGLVLVGLPFLMPYALISLTTMVAVIALAIWARQRFGNPVS